jgi:hypothetical protein
MQKPGLFGMNGVLVLFLSFLSVAARAQQTGSLILIDAENKQAFTVRIGDQLYASSGHGHLVLSHLRDSSYRLNLRFPKKYLAEQVFPVTIHQKDLGFQLRGNDSTWVLYNWQTKETIRPVNEKDSSRILDQGVRREDGFSKLMAAVVNDTSVMYNTYMGNGFHADSPAVKPPTTNGPPPTVNRQPSTDTTRSTVILPPTVNRPPPTVAVSDKRRLKDSLLAVKKANAATRDSLLAVKKANASKDSLLAVQKAAATRDSTIVAQKTTATRDSLLAINGQPSTANGQRSTVNGQRSSILPPGVKKLREVSLKISRKLVYLDVGRDGLTDTVTLFVYFETSDTAVSNPPLPALSLKKTRLKDSTVLPAPLVKIKPALAIRTNGQGCAQLATDGDLESLRSAILSANTEQDKMTAATAAFSVKCYSVSQVRVLAGLFVSDKSRYRLMDAAHLHISDQDHFRELADMYTDKNFQKKFLLMTGKRS